MGAGLSARYRGVVCIGAYNSRVEIFCELLAIECKYLVLIVPKKSPTDEFTPGTIVLEGCGSVDGSLRSCFDIIETLNIDVDLCVVVPLGLTEHCDVSRLFYHSYVCTAFAVLSEYSSGSQVVFSQLEPELWLANCGLVGLLKCVKVEQPNLNVWIANGVGYLVGFRNYRAAHFVCNLMVRSGL